MSDWLVVCTAPRREFRAELELARAGFETFLPTERRWAVQRGFRQFTTRPLLPGYLFAAIESTAGGLASPWTAILRIQVVRGLLFHDGRPACLQASAIDHLREAHDLGLWDETTAVAKLPIGSKVRIISGPLANFAARLKAVRGPKRIQLLVHMLGKDCSVTMPIEKVRAA